DPRGAGPAVGPLRRRAPARRALWRFPAPRRDHRPAALPHPRPGRSGAGRSRARRRHRLKPSPASGVAPMSLTAPRDAANAPDPEEPDLAALNAELEAMDAEQRVAWALAYGHGNPALSSSFGAQAAVTLHMVTRQKPDIPVILIDTGYLFPETYRFADELTERLQLNLKVYRPL